MDTGQVARELRLQHWTGVLGERKNSGLSIRSWCQENGVNEKTYYYWQRKLRENACESLVLRQESAIPPSPTFAQVQVPMLSRDSGVITVRLGNAEISIAGNASPAAIEAVLVALRVQ